jgi:hypothetical protein
MACFNRAALIMERHAQRHNVLRVGVRMLPVVTGEISLAEYSG